MAELPGWAGESLDTAPGDVRTRAVAALELLPVTERAGGVEFQRWLWLHGRYASDGGPRPDDGSVLALFARAIA